jgi:hypothetical protein
LICRFTPHNLGHRFEGQRASTLEKSAGAIVTFVGLCIVLVKVARVPEYWIPLMVGVGLLLFGLLRRLTRRDT